MNEDSTNQRILAAAGPIFANKGFRGATIREISVAANVNLASINYYFGDKQNLYLETVKLAHQMRMQEFPTPQTPPTTCAKSRLREFVQLLLNRLVAVKVAPWQVTLLIREFVNPSGNCREIVEEFVRPSFDALSKIIDELVDSALPHHRVQQTAISIFAQCLHYRCASESISMVVSPIEFAQYYDVEQLTEHITLFSLGAIDKIKKSAPQVA